MFNFFGVISYTDLKARLEPLKKRRPPRSVHWRPTARLLWGDFDHGACRRGSSRYSQILPGRQERRCLVDVPAAEGFFLGSVSEVHKLCRSRSHGSERVSRVSTRRWSAMLLSTRNKVR